MSFLRESAGLFSCRKKLLTNVTERIREIGPRKALGARSRDITRQFPFEAIGLCVAGGVIGIVLGFLMSWGLAGIMGAPGLTTGLSSISPGPSPRRPTRWCEAGLVRGLRNFFAV